MSFREKSAWAMGAVMLATGLFYLHIVSSLPPDIPAIAQLGPLIPYVMAATILSVVVQILLTLFYRKDATQRADEREQAAIDKAGHWSGIVLAVAVVNGALQYLWYGEGNLLFQWIVGGLILAQLSEFVFQIFLFRRGA